MFIQINDRGSNPHYQSVRHAAVLSIGISNLVCVSVSYYKVDDEVGRVRSQDGDLRKGPGDVRGVHHDVSSARALPSSLPVLGRIGRQLDVVTADDGEVYLLVVQWEN